MVEYIAAESQTHNTTPAVEYNNIAGHDCKIVTSHTTHVSLASHTILISQIRFYTAPSLENMKQSCSCMSADLGSQRECVHVFGQKVSIPVRRWIKGVAWLDRR